MDRDPDKELRRGIALIVVLCAGTLLAFLLFALAQYLFALFT